MVKEEKDETLIALYKIEDRLAEIVEILKVGHKETIEAVRRKALSRSVIRGEIYDLCDGRKSVSEIAKALGKSVQQVSNNISILQSSGLIREIRKGKEKYYEKMR